MDKIICRLLILISLCLHFGSAIFCYECNSHYNLSCAGTNGEKLNPDYKINCDLIMPNATNCRKILQNVDFEEGGIGPDARVIRKCGTDQPSNRGYYYRSGYGGRVEVYTCWPHDDDKACNIATHNIFNVKIHTLVIFGLIPMAFIKILL